FWADLEFCASAGGSAAAAAASGPGCPAARESPGCCWGSWFVVRGSWFVGDVLAERSGRSFWASAGGSTLFEVHTAGGISARAASRSWRDSMPSQARQTPVSHRGLAALLGVHSWR